MVFAVLVAFLLIAAVIAFSGLVFVGGLVALMGDKKPTLERGSVLVFDLGINLTDAPPATTGAEVVNELLGMGGPPVLSLRSVVNALEAAAKDDRVSGVYLHGSFSASTSGGGFPALREVRAALEAVREAGKPVVAYLTLATTRDVYLASVADEIYLNPAGMLITPGLSVRPFFLTGMLEKYGIGVEVVRAGRYKTAMDFVTEHELSPEDREQLGDLLDGLWSTFLLTVSESRGLTPGQLQELVDDEGFITPPTAHAAGLVDELAFFPEVVERLQGIGGATRNGQSFRQTSLPAYIDLLDATKRPPVRDKVAVIYAEGIIIDGEGDAGMVGADRFARELRQLRHDGSVKAVVLRVNSLGGSASASEVIQREVELTAREKPLVVSFGDSAASGGYLISTHGNHIFTQPDTITGSIGVVITMLDLSELLDRQGVAFDGLKTGRFADLTAVSRAKTEEEIELVRGWVDSSYDQFLDFVAEGRSMSREQVEAIAQGRVWTGEQAVELGLADAIGGLGDAIRHAAELAGIADRYTVVDHPPPVDFFEQLLESLAKQDRPLSGVAGRLPSPLRTIVADLEILQKLNDPRGRHMILPIRVEIP